MLENKNELLSSHKFGRFATITMTEWSNGSFSISKSQLKDKSKGWKDKDNIERITLLQLYYNELFQVFEVLNNRKSIGNFEFKQEKIADDGVLKIIIIKHYKNKEGKEDSKNYEMTTNEYYIIRTLIKRVIEVDYEVYTPNSNKDHTSVDNSNFNEVVETPEQPEYLDEDIPF